MVIALSGHRGFIGSHIKKAFGEDRLILLNREDIYGNTEELAAKIQGAQIVMNFAGYTVSKRWTKKNRARIYTSRIGVTENIVRAINKLKNPPAFFINASAIGIYGQNEVHNELEYSFSDDFLAGVIKRWEQSAAYVKEPVKLVTVRLGLVLGRDGGAMPRLFRLFRYGLGGVIGSGKQIYSFINIDDVIYALQFIIKNNGSGVYNFTAPFPVSNEVFTKTIASKMKRPAIFRIPGILVRFVLGKASIIVVGGQTVYPMRLLEEGYSFTFATIQESITNLIEET